MKKRTTLIGYLVFTNEIVGRGVQRLVDKEKKGLVQREEESPAYDGQPTVKKVRIPRTMVPGCWSLLTEV